MDLIKRAMETLQKSGEYTQEQLAALYGTILVGYDADADILKKQIGTYFYEILMGTN